MLKIERLIFLYELKMATNGSVIPVWDVKRYLLTHLSTHDTLTLRILNSEHYALITPHLEDFLAFFEKYRDWSSWAILLQAYEQNRQDIIKHAEFAWKHVKFTPTWISRQTQTPNWYKSLEDACQHGYIYLAKEIVAANHGAITHNNFIQLLEKAVMRGHLEVFKWLYPLAAVNWSMAEDCFRIASRYGRLNILRYIWESRTDNNWQQPVNHVAEEAAMYGYLDILKWARPLAKKNTDSLFALAIEWHQFEIIAELIPHVTSSCLNDSCCKSIYTIVCKDNGPVRVLRILDRRSRMEGRPPKKEYLKIAIEHQHIDAVRYIHKMWGCFIINSEHINEAIVVGSLPIVQYLMGYYEVCVDIIFFEKACCCGHLEMAQWLYSIILLTDGIVPNDILQNNIKPAIRKWLRSL